jgi:hypothetical protein
VTTPSRTRTLVPFGTFLFIVVVLAIGSSRIAEAQQRGRGAQRPATPPAAAPAPTPQISATAIRVVGAGLGANGSELRPFNESPGTVVVLAIQAPRGSGIVQIDTRGSTLENFADDKGQSLLEEGRIGSFPKIAEDGSAAIVEAEVRARPSAGTTSVTVQGSIAMTLAGGSKPTRVANVRLVTGQTFKVGTATMTVGEVATEEDSTKVTIGLTRTVLNTIREVRVFDAKNTPIEARRTGSGYMNDKAEMQYDMKTKDKMVTLEFELWQNQRVIKAPFNVQAGLGLAAGPRAASSTDAAAGAGSNTVKPEPVAAKPPLPPPVIGANDGAQSVEAVVKQMQSAASAGKGAQLLAVVHPHDRPLYGQAVAMTLVFLPMSAMDNEKEATRITNDLDAFFAKHQLKPPFTREPADLFKNVDLGAFVSGAMAFMKSHAKKGEKAADSLPVPSGRPENVKITGDEAIATLSGKDVKFTKISGRWFIRLDE